MPIIVKGYKKAYKIVRAYSLDLLEERVEELLAEGFYCVDGVVVSPLTPNRQDHPAKYLQTMMLNEKIPQPEEDEEEEE